MKRFLFCITFFVFAISAVFSQVKSNAKITVSPLILQNGSEENNWIPLFVQGQLTSDIQNYSDFQVIDRISAAQLAGEQRAMETAAAVNNDDITIQYAELLSADYTVIVTLIKKDSSYALNAKVLSVQTSSTVGKAYSNPNVYEQSISDGSAVHALAYELLLGLGISESKLADLKKAQTEAQINAVLAQQNLAKGIIAEQSGMNIEAMSYYMKAAGGNDKLKEAMQRLSQTSQKVSSGNFGKDAENKIRFRNQWIELLKQTVKTLEKDPPFFFMYEPKLTPLELEKDDYKDGTQSFLIKGGLYCSDEIDIIKNLKNALKKIPESENWGEVVTNFPRSLASEHSWLQSDSDSGVFVTISLKNKDNKKLQSETFKYRVGSGWAYFDGIRHIKSDGKWYGHYNENGRNNFKSSPGNLVISKVPVSDLVSTDTLIISVDSIIYYYESNYNPKTENWQIPVMTTDAMAKNITLGIEPYQTLFGTAIRTRPVKLWKKEFISELKDLELDSSYNYEKNPNDYAYFKSAKIQVNGISFEGKGTSFYKSGESCYAGIIFDENGQIIEVFNNSPAAKAGIQVGDKFDFSRIDKIDILYKLADIVINNNPPDNYYRKTDYTDKRSSEEYRSLFPPSFSSGDILTLPLTRDGKPYVAKVELIAKQNITYKDVCETILPIKQDYQNLCDTYISEFSGHSCRFEYAGFEMKEEWNPVVSKVNPDSPAQKAGLQVGDVIYKQKPDDFFSDRDNMLFLACKDIKKQIEKMKVGDVYTVYCKRKKEKLKIEIKLEYTLSEEKKSEFIIKAVNNYMHNKSFF
ncbi:MAG: hypothetical protein K6A43_05145 [Treponema sp.]|nr:hypothetical protein [Treponema sp.]